ncbi:B12-binding domain-containing radical SAM protein [Maribellus mangrovi]|uniref:B12-binding domain-containing radical SAM protein n=1 Tax=Maribellus mangrovi TaxID=3133146 RepID=UPI0030EF6350
MIPPLINPIVKKREDDFVPLGLLTLASILRIKNEVAIYEPKHRLIESEDYLTVARDILSHQPDVLGFSTWCISYASSLLIAKAIKSLQPNIKIIFGGPQASITAKETLSQFTFVDYILKGEADLSLPLLLDEIAGNKSDLSQVPGLIYRNSTDEIKENCLALPIQKLDDLPIPAYDLFPAKKTVKLDIGRGCPFKCTYCTTNDFFSKKHRTKSVNRVIQEMLSVREKLHISNIGFAHDMLTMNRKFVFELCDGLIQLKNEKEIEFKWTCSARIDCISKEMLVQMEKAGCESVFFGIETGSPRVQKQIQKNLDIKKSYALADTCRAIGLNMFASFILGFPEETKSDFEQTLETLLKLASKGCFVQSSELSLLPGTPLYESHKDKLKYDGNFSNFSNTLCGKEELKLIRKYPELFSSFYYLPVKTLKREEMVFLNKLINKMNLFRNTIYLLSDSIRADAKTVELVHVVKEVYKQLHPKKESNLPVVVHWIHILSHYIEQRNNNLPPYFRDIFNLDSYVALILTINSKWRLNHIPKTQKVVSNDSQILPTPVWKILKTNYILESIIPSKNGWRNNKKHLRKGLYYYLIVAISPIKCKKIRLNQKEVHFLENLSKLNFSDYVKKNKSVGSKKEILSWLKKMQRLGVVELSNKID